MACCTATMTELVCTMHLSPFEAHQQSGYTLYKQFRENAYGMKKLWLSKIINEFTTWKLVVKKNDSMSWKIVYNVEDVVYYLSINMIKNTSSNGIHGWDSIIVCTMCIRIL